ncbi:hypothetical protein [Paenibacillus sacheonensis]|uniref:PspA/IM30 family protein n=1 Tax=Paenibacillus sacheonensis TaxID=742054 RepID=A0A7X4YQA1_9BACL|nr:hypothetical protein [Paenibacillus sacheonensis]MBM7566362.1 hypothetical protein [Paenibacillus sacheonensis]NBC70565.1 hypothetical protein [Paenibacillus sacheonensis]
MGLMGRIKGLFGSAEPSGSRGEPSFEAYLEAAGEKLRDYAVIISKLESELLNAKDRMRGLERQAAGFRASAEEAAARSDSVGARTWLEKEFETKKKLESSQVAARSMEAGLLETKARYAAFKQAVDEAGGKHDTLRLRKLTASSELEAGQAVSASRYEAELARLTQGKSDDLDEEIAKLMRERKTEQ